MEVATEKTGTWQKVTTWGCSNCRVLLHILEGEDPHKLKGTCPNCGASMKAEETAGGEERTESTWNP